MSEQARDAIAADVAEMMTRYSFDLGGYTLTRWLDQWLQNYPAVWLPGAVTEALYQGRYKAISVWQILDLWRRRGKPLQHFNREFERMVSGRALQLLFSPSPSDLSQATATEPLLVSASANGRPSWAQNGRLVDVDWRQQASSHSGLTALTAATPLPFMAASSSEPETDRASDIAPPHPAIAPFKPSEQFKLSLPSEIHRTRAEAAKYPIQQFVPSPISSDFHDKLKAIAQALSMANAHATANWLANARQTMQQDVANPPEELAHLEHQNNVPDMSETSTQVTDQDRTYTE